MKITISSDTLSQILSGLVKVLNTKNSLAILDHYLIEVTGMTMTIVASDGENTMKYLSILQESDVQSSETVRFCIHSRMLEDFLKNLPTQPITISKGDTGLTVEYDNGQINIPVVDGKDYPKLREMTGGNCKTVKLPGNIMLEDISRASSFVAMDTFRPVMNTICFYFKNECLDVVGTNGQVMMKSSHSNINTEEETYFLLPPKPAALLKHSLSKDEGEISIKFNANTAQILGTNWELTCQLVEGKYPNYNSVIPKDNDKTLLIDKRALQEAIRRIMPMNNQEMKTIKMELGYSELILSCEDVDFNTSAKETMTCEYDGNPLTIGVNGQKFSSVLATMPAEKVKCTFSDYNRAFLVMPYEGNGECVALMMPHFLNN